MRPRPLNGSQFFETSSLDPRRIIECAIVSQNSSFLLFPLELIKRWFVRIESSRDGNVTLVNASTPCSILRIVYDFPRLQYHAEKLTFLRLNNTGLNQMINSDSKKKKNTISTPCLSKPYIYIYIYIFRLYMLLRSHKRDSSVHSVINGGNALAPWLQIAAYIARRSLRPTSIHRHVNKHAGAPKRKLV